MALGVRGSIGVVALVAGLAPARSAPCQTQVQGTVSGVWTLSGSPYCVEGPLTVGDLVVEAGVVVRVAPGVAIEVTGSLTVQGTGAQPVRFEREDPDSAWQGLLLSAAQGSSLVHCRIAGAANSGLSIVDCSPVLASCVVEDNRAPDQGAGIRASLASGDLVLSDCRIAGNRIVGTGDPLGQIVLGGGLWAELGQGKLVLERCVVEQNALEVPPGDYVIVRGGGIHAMAAGGVELTDCTLLGNLCAGTCTGVFCNAVTDGGGIFVNGGSLTLTRCVVQGNQGLASDTPLNSQDAYVISRGGGLYFAGPGNVLLRDSLFVENHSSAVANAVGLDGCGVYASLVSLSALGCTVARNSGHSQGIGVTTGLGFGLPAIQSAVIASSVVHGNFRVGSFSSTQINGSPAVHHSLVQGGYAGAGNLDGNPAFVDPANGDYSLQPESPCVDAGDPSTVSSGLDVGGSPRFLDGLLDGTRVVDMGAHELDNVHLAVTGAATPGGALSVEVSGNPAVVPVLVVGLSRPTPLPLQPWGPLFALPLAAPLTVLPPLPTSLVLSIPSTTPVPLDLTFQVLGLVPPLRVGSSPGNLSNPVRVLVQ